MEGLQLNEFEMKIKWMFLILMLVSATVNAQMTQTLRGSVLDRTTKQPLPAANVGVIVGERTIGTTTNEQGEFSLINIPVGRCQLQVSFMGYEPQLLANLEIQSGKQKVVNIELVEKVVDVDEVVVTARGKGETWNEMAVASVRTFSVRETERYAGSLGDPSRMASNFAGVVTANDSRNDIIIRGNSPQGLLWRLDGISIPNPNHYGALGSTGGPVSMLNNNVLTNSDFFTGAFPAEYGNALSGVFDLRMRNGNNRKHEFMGQIGFNGFEAGVEGPISLKNGSSYMVNYRYSVPALMDRLGFSAAGGAVPIYQDLTLKINLPTKALGTFSLLAIGGKSEIEFEQSDEEGESTYNTSNDTRTRNGSKMGVVGLTHRLLPDSKSNVYTTLAFSHQSVATQIDSVAPNAFEKRYYGEGHYENKLSWNTRYTRKINTRNTYNLGVGLDEFTIDYRDSVTGEAFDPPVYGTFFHSLDTHESGLLLAQYFAEWQHRVNARLTLYGGLHGQYFFMNDTHAIDPRASIAYKMNDGAKFSLAYGKHAQIQQLYTYFTESYDTDTRKTWRTNTNLDMTQAHHWVASYDRMLAPNLKLKVESYFQLLNKVPVTSYESYFSQVNAGGSFHQDRVDSLVNEGRGRNYGLEFTLEKYLSNNVYFLLTSSLFDSKYLASDKQWRNTEFNTNYIVNALAGYQIPINGRMSVDMNAKVIWSGGKRNPYIDLEQSKLKGEEVYDHSKSYSTREADYFRLDTRVALVLNSKRITQEWALDITNLTNHQNIFSTFYSSKEQSVKYVYQQGIYPMFLYRLNF